MNLVWNLEKEYRGYEIIPTLRYGQYICYFWEVGISYIADYKLCNSNHVHDTVSIFKRSSGPHNNGWRAINFDPGLELDNRSPDDVANGTLYYVLSTRYAVDAPLARRPRQFNSHMIAKI